MWLRSWHRDPRACLSCKIFRPIDFFGSRRFEDPKRPVEPRGLIRFDCNQDRAGSNFLLDSGPAVYWNSDAGQCARAAGQAAADAANRSSTEGPDYRADDCQRSEYGSSENGEPG